MICWEEISISAMTMTMNRKDYESFDYDETRSSKDECSTGDQTIIIVFFFLDHRSSITKDQKF